MDWFYGLAEPFVRDAPRAFRVAGAFLLLYAVARLVQANRPRISAKPVLCVAVAWLVFALLEAEATREGADIRVDLLLTWPALSLTTVVGLGHWLRNVARFSGTVSG